MGCSNEGFPRKTNGGLVILNLSWVIVQVGIDEKCLAFLFVQAF